MKLRIGEPLGLVLVAAVFLAGCDLVLGIDDVSAANGPDASTRIQGQTAEPRDASDDDGG